MWTENSTIIRNSRYEHLVPLYETRTSVQMRTERSSNVSSLSPTSYDDIYSFVPYNIYVCVYTWRVFIRITRV